MSEYRTCRACDRDLGSDGRGFGADECCCDRGYCSNCCPEVVERRRAATESAEPAW